jgi:hypothetical protein
VNATPVRTVRAGEGGLYIDDSGESSQTKPNAPSTRLGLGDYWIPS